MPRIELQPSERVVVTGMGCVTPLGLDVESSWEALINGKDGIRNIRDTILRDYSEDKIKTSLGAPAIGFDLLSDPSFNTREGKKNLKKWHRSAQFVLWASAQALRQASLISGESLKVDQEQVDPERFGVSMGTGVGGAIKFEEVRKIIDSEGETGQEERATPSHILQALPGRVDEGASIVFDARAFTDTTLAECAAGTASMARAVDDIRLGRADVVLAGGVEAALTPTSIAIFEATGAVSSATDRSQAPRPFNEKIPGDGLVFGEGAGVVVLETLKRARARGAVVLAEVLGYGKSSDARHETLSSGEGSVRALRRALVEARLAVSDVNNAYINAHATGTIGDVLELEAISQVFSPEQIAGITSTKGATGHMFGAAGTIEAIFSILALRDSVIPPNLRLDNPLPQAERWNMSPMEATPVDSGIDFAINNSFGFGGKNHVMIFGR